MLPPKPLLKGLIHRLVIDAHLDEAKAIEAVQQAAARQTPIVQYLIEHRLVKANVLAHTLAQFFGLPLLDLNAFDPELIPAKLIDERLIERHQVLPLLKKGHRLYLAVIDPSNLAALDEIKFHTGATLFSIIVEADKLAACIAQVLNAKEAASLNSLEANLETFELSTDAEEKTASKEAEMDDAPIVRFVNKILLDAIHKGVSDIHFEPYEKHYRVRYRQDGLLYEAASPPASLGSRIAARVKILSQLDISERRIPQDGRFKMDLSKQRAIDFRVSTCPTIHGEKIVMRILDPTSATLGIEALGFEPKQQELFLTAIHKPQGMILVTGPTGSGKTVTLYTALNILNESMVNISTVEDPVEIHLSGVNQVNINLKTGMTFATALRAFLRQDPDVVMVGEMRDLETAEIGIKAAQTGHMVLSTLHTNSAPETLTRFLNMGVEAFNIATSISLIIAQRLVRKLCPRCKRPAQIPAHELLKLGFSEAELPLLTVYEAVGCEACREGYLGRTGVYELLPMTPAIGHIIMAGGNSIDIARVAREEGMQTLHESGLVKVRQGLTSLSEVNRVTIE